jgi:DNA-binding NarL/FixJ family response regulator
MTDDSAVLGQARAAYRSHEWQRARDAFDRAAVSAPLDGRDLRDLAACHWWLGEAGECLERLDEAFRRFRVEGADEDAARTALLIALLRITRADLTVGRAWLGRARRLLEALPDGAPHAYLAYLETSMGFDETGDQWSAQGVARMGELARELDDPAVGALSAVVSGMHAVRAGDTAEGFAQLDEAMLCVVSGEVEPAWAGDVLCTTIHACHELADYRRMADWTRATEAWSTEYGSDAVYAGVCRVHRLELRSAAGDWPGAEKELARTSAQLEASDAWVAGAGWYQLGELRRLRGDADGAREAFALSRASGVDPAPGEALLELDSGRPDRAWAVLTAALAARDRLGRVRMLRAGVRIALARADSEAASSFLTELDDAARVYGTDGFRAWTDHARGMCALHRSDPEAASASLHSALDRFRRLGQRWEQAHVLAWIAAAHDALGEPHSAAQVRAEAAAILGGLGAHPIEVVLPAAAEPAGPLTARENEILALVAQGLSNRAIADRLFISEKTVGRHLANVYLKLSVSSRTAAAAWWHEQAAGGGIR